MADNEIPFNEIYASHMKFGAKIGNEVKPTFNAKGKRVTEAKPAPYPVNMKLPAEDEFGGNSNNRRVTERAEADRRQVAGEITVDQNKKVRTKINAEVQKEIAAASGVDPDEHDGKPVWKPNA